MEKDDFIRLWHRHMNLWLLAMPCHSISSNYVQVYIKIYSKLLYFVVKFSISSYFAIRKFLSLFSIDCFKTWESNVLIYLLSIRLSINMHNIFCSKRSQHVGISNHSRFIDVAISEQSLQQCIPSAFYENFQN